MVTVIGRLQVSMPFRWNHIRNAEHGIRNNFMIDVMTRNRYFTNLFNN
jgi:hypothetical protein